MKPTRLVFFNYGTEYINEHTGTFRKNNYRGRDEKIEIRKPIISDSQFINYPEDTKVIY